MKRAKGVVFWATMLSVMWTVLGWYPRKIFPRHEGWQNCGRRGWGREAYERRKRFTIRFVLQACEWGFNAWVGGHWLGSVVLNDGGRAVIETRDRSLDNPTRWVRIRIPPSTGIGAQATNNGFLGWWMQDPRSVSSKDAGTGIFEIGRVGRQPCGFGKLM